jgi:NAD+ diphosphatase
MQEYSLYDRYKPAYIPDGLPNEPTCWFIFQKDRLLTKTEAGGPQIPNQTVLAHFSRHEITRQYLGDLDQRGCYCLAADEVAQTPDGYEFSTLRALAGRLDDQAFLLAGRASQILHWDLLSRFCGRCGTSTRMKDDERAKQCDTCGNIIYPRISPAVIIAILQGNQILLAHNKNFHGNMYSILAGFMEPGENFEDTARREVFEEVGIQIKNLRYYGSQPWPFPDSLMVGFVGEYASGEIRADGKEIDDAAWFERGRLPEIPPPFSIAGRMVRWFEAGAQI